MTDFLSTAVWIFDFLVMGLLPAAAAIIFVVYLMQILSIMRQKIIKMYKEGEGAMLEPLRK